jgi:hypothetical protein
MMPSTQYCCRAGLQACALDPRNQSSAFAFRDYVAVKERRT